MKTHGRSIHKLVPACVYDVLYTLVFVVANKLGTGQPDLLWHAARTQVLNVPALPEPEQPDADRIIGSNKGNTTNKSADRLEFAPLFKGEDDEMSVQAEDTKGQETLEEETDRQRQREMCI